MNIAAYSIRHRVVSWLFTLVLLVGGIVSFTRLGQLEDPEFTIAAGSPIAGPSAIPASTSATWNTRMGLPLRRRHPAMFNRQPRSPPNNVSAPVWITLFALFSTIRDEISGYLTQNRPPNPHATAFS